MILSASTIARFPLAFTAYPSSFWIAAPINRLVFPLDWASQIVVEPRLPCPLPRALEPVASESAGPRVTAKCRVGFVSRS